MDTFSKLGRQTLGAEDESCSYPGTAAGCKWYWPRLQRRVRGDRMTKNGEPARRGRQNCLSEQKEKRSL